MARKGNDEEEQPKKPNKKELRSERNAAKKQAKDQPQYKEEKVDVKASARSKAHKETRRVRIKDEKSFEAGATAGGQQKRPKGDPGEAQRNPPVNPKLHKKLVDAGAPDSELENSRPPQVNRPPMAGIADWGNLSSRQVQRHAAARAVQIAGQLQQDEEYTPKQAQRAAAKQVVEEVQLAYHTGATPEEKKSTRGLSAQKLTVQDVMSAAFPAYPKEPSTSEKAVHTPKSKGQKSVEKVNSRAKEFKGSSTKGASNVKTADLHKQVAEHRERKTKLYPGKSVTKSKISNRQFLESRPTEEQAWIEKQTNTPGGLFYGAKGNKVPGAYRKWQRYVNARQEGYSDRDNITEWLTKDTRGKYQRTNPTRKDKPITDKLIKDRYTGGVRKKEGTKPRDRYKSAIPSHEDFGVGIRVPGIPSDREFKEMFPDKSDSEIDELKQSALQSIDEDFMKNSRMAHEQRQQMVLHNSKAETAASNEDRVVFFTTSTGWPAVSVGANSLLGQYVIKKRKKMLYDQRMASRAELKGEYPWAVRDQHIMEVATGLSVGAQGRYGAFRHVGYRMGSKKSKGYGKTLPVGAQILRDSTGQPIYDRNGNIRYTEGFTRPFDIRPSNEVGMRLYLG